MKTFYFTATGNSLYVAKKIGGEVCSIPQMLKEGTPEFEDEAIGFVFPCYAFGVPRIVTDFIQQAQFRAEYFFAVMTYGNMAASGLRHLEEVGREAGIQFDYTNEILMVDNFLPLFNIEDQLNKESAKMIEAKLDQIIGDVAGRQKRQTRKGLVSDVFSKPVHDITAQIHYDAGDKRFIVQNSCNGCKVCEAVCPKSNIKVGRAPEYLHQCEGCYACIHHCPQNAIHLKYERSQARFINRNVTLKEIIDANNQYHTGGEM